MKYFIILIAFMPSIAFGQIVSVSQSLESIGKVTETKTISFQYKDIGIHYFSIEQPQLVKRSVTQNNAFAISYMPVEIKFLEAGIIVFDKPFPSKNATRVNAIFDIGITLGNKRISFQHISNAFTGSANPGIDMITFSLSI